MKKDTLEITFQKSNVMLFSYQGKRRMRTANNFCHGPNDGEVRESRGVFWENMDIYGVIMCIDVEGKNAEPRVIWMSFCGCC